MHILIIDHEFGETYIVSKRVLLEFCTQVFVKVSTKFTLFCPHLQSLQMVKASTERNLNLAQFSKLTPFKFLAAIAAL